MSQEFYEGKIRYEEKFQKIKTSLITKYLIEKLKKEQELVRYNNSKLNSIYLNLLRKEKRKEILENINIFKLLVENFLKLKSSIENIFEKSFQDDADLNLFIFTNFIFIKDKLIENFLENTLLLKDDFSKKVKEIKIDFDNDKIQIQNNYANHLKEIENQILAIETNFYFDMQNDKKNLIEQKESLKCEHLDQIMLLKINMERKLNSIQRIFEETKQLVDREMALMTKPDEIDSKNNKIEAELIKNKLKIKSLEEKCKGLNDECNLVDIEFLLKNKKNAINQKYFQYTLLIKKISIQKNRIKKNILNLVKQSSLAINYLDKNLNKCKKILKLFEICQKLETVEEQKNFFCKPNIKSEINKEKVFFKFFGPIDSIESEFVKNLFNNNDQINNQYNFYLKYSKVNSEIKSLKLVKLDLEKENLNLKQTLNNYICDLEI